MHQYSQRALLGLTLGLGLLFANTPDSRADDGGEILDRGPVHEAFANAVVYNPEPGPLVAKAPPAPIEELPPETKPDGVNVLWISGYWAWDDERNDFIWISGIWRDIPPGRAWVPGYWLTSDEGARWVAGYWGDTSRGQAQTEYLPVAPPASLEVGPNTPAPSDESIWVSGYWLWQSNRYIWSPGCWHTVRPEYSWVPASYLWTPHGYLFVGGYWDYVIARRGVVYAPVYFRTGYPYYPGHYYRPYSIVSISVFDDCLFYRPRYGHYYYGNYYGDYYSSAGFQISFNFHSRGGGYDPIYARQRWDHRHKPDWDRNHRSSYEKRRTEAPNRTAQNFPSNTLANTRPDRNASTQDGTGRTSRTEQPSGKFGDKDKDKNGDKEKNKTREPSPITHSRQDNLTAQTSPTVPRRGDGTPGLKSAPVETIPAAKPRVDESPSRTSAFSKPEKESKSGKQSSIPAQPSVVRLEPTPVTTPKTPRPLPQTSLVEPKPESPAQKIRVSGDGQRSTVPTTPRVTPFQSQGNKPATPVTQSNHSAFQRERTTQPANSPSVSPRYSPGRTQQPSAPQRSSPTQSGRSRQSADQELISEKSGRPFR